MVTHLYPSMDLYMWFAYMDVMSYFQVDDDLEIKAYYAGHVLGAVMFQMKVGTESVVYTVSYYICYFISFAYLYGRRHAMRT